MELLFRLDYFQFVVCCTVFGEFLNKHKKMFISSRVFVSNFVSEMV